MTWVWWRIKIWREQGFLLIVWFKLITGGWYFPWREVSFRVWQRVVIVTCFIVFVWFCHSWKDWALTIVRRFHLVNLYWRLRFTWWVWLVIWVNGLVFQSFGSVDWFCWTVLGWIRWVVIIFILFGFGSFSLSIISRSVSYCSLFILPRNLSLFFITSQFAPTNPLFLLPNIWTISLL